MISAFFRPLYELYIAPKSQMVDDRRREFILNTLLVGLLTVASVALGYSFYNFFVLHNNHFGFWQTGGFWLVVVGLLRLSRWGLVRYAALLFIGFLWLSGVDFALFWGFGLPEAQLLFVLTIVIAGVLFSAPRALLTSLIMAVTLAVIAFLQTHHLQSPVYTQWRQHPFNASDVVGYVAIFLIIGFVSWLSNQEIDRALHRARRSEQALQRERDNLERKVIERTRELEALQLQRLLELQPFAEFGRIGASLVHEISNPLTAATLQLEELSKDQRSEVVRQIQRNLLQLERYLLAARKQIKRESPHVRFSVGAESRQIVNLLRHRARKANVQLMSNRVSNIWLRGDVVKFNQLVANLLANAIDASENNALTPQSVGLDIRQDGPLVIIRVTDFGSGITPKLMDHLFEPFFSTKKSPRSGLGIGLAMVKQYVEHDFNGSIEVTSSKAGGTVFTVTLRGAAS